MKGFQPQLELQIAWRYLGAQRKSLFVSLISLFSMLGVFIGSFALVVALSAINGFEKAVTKQMIGKDSHFEIMAYHSTPVLSWDSLAQVVRDNDPDIVAEAPFILYKMGISSRRVNDGIVVYGIDTEKSRNVVNLHEKIKWGEYSLDSTVDSTGRKFPSMILGSVLASRLKLLLGDRVILQTFQSPEAGMGGFAPRMMQFRVVGIFETGMFEYDANLSYIGIPEAQVLLDMPNAVTGVQFKVRDPWKSDIHAEKAQQLLGYPYYALDWKAKNITLLKWMNYEKVIVATILCLIILVAAFNIISSLIMVVLEKTREIGILRGMGISKGSIMRIFIWMGSFIGLAGTTLGVTTGLGLCFAQYYFEFITLPPDVYMISVFPVEVQWPDVIAVYIVANLLCVLATIFPAWKASRLDPVGAIRHD